MLRNDTICALATPSGIGAIAVIRLSGESAIELTDAVFKSPNGRKKLSEQPGYTAHFGSIVDHAEVVDEVLVTVFKAPHSFTGENSIEISCHGSPLIQNKILQLLIKTGARMADPGEFTMRAFINGKMDLSQAEAVADLIAAENEAAHKVALQQMRGGFSKEIDQLREELINFASLIELELDFAEEDVEFADRSKLNELVNTIDKALRRLIDSFRTGNAVKNGVSVAIVGKPNAGKSTLLNALLNEERAIVSDIPGTTRDTVEETISIGGILFRFIDTAGLRRTSDTVEKLGIERSYKKASEASLVVLLGDGTVLSEGALRTEASMLRKKVGDGPEILPVLNKMDVPGTRQPKETLTLSARKGSGMDALKQRFVDHVQGLRNGPGDTVVTNARHVEALTKARAALQESQKAIELGISGELLAIDLRRAQHHLGEITGRITTDDLLGSIFGRFCIGK